MTLKKYKKIKLPLTLLLVLFTGYSIYIQNTAISLLSLGLYMAVITLIRTRVKGVLIDERQQEVIGKASQISFQILIPILLFSTLAMFIGGGNEEFYYVKALGVVLAYITCLGVLIYLLSYWYFNKKTGGK